MIVVDTSALIAVSRNEPGAAPLRRLIRLETIVIGAPTLVETFMVVHGRGRANAGTYLDEIIAATNVSVVAFELAHYRAAQGAFSRYGKGQGSPAQLNYGDCMSYALAKVSGAPLLFKGGDFRHTDIRAHPASTS